MPRWSLSSLTTSSESASLLRCIHTKRSSTRIFFGRVAVRKLSKDEIRTITADLKRIAQIVRSTDCLQKVLRERPQNRSRSARTRKGSEHELCLRSMRDHSISYPGFLCGISLKSRPVATSNSMTRRIPAWSTGRRFAYPFLPVSVNHRHSTEIRCLVTCHCSSRYGHNSGPDTFGHQTEHSVKVSDSQR